jgi:hypothetical protein
MAEVQCVRVRIQPGKTEQVVAFLKNLPNRPNEIQEALHSEGIILESLFLDRQPQADYLIFYTRAKNLAQANATFVSSTLPLDLETKQFIAETWAEVTLLETVVDLEVHERD